MTTVLFQRVDGLKAGESIAMPEGRRRLSSVVRSYADRSRPHIVSVHRKKHVLAVTDFSVRLRKSWRNTTVGSHDTVIIVYLPQGGGGAGARGGGGKSTGVAIGLVVASLALAALGQFWAIGALAPYVGGSAVAGRIWASVAAAPVAGPSFLIPKGSSKLTAINAFSRDGAAYIYTDGQAYTIDGDILGETRKVDIIAHLPAAIAVRGLSIVRNAIAYQAAERFKSFDELVIGLPELLRLVRGGLGIRSETSVGEVFIAGHSAERDGVEIWTIADADRPGLAAYEMMELGASIVPLDDALVREILGAGLEIESGNPVEIGPAITRLQRDRKWPLQFNGRLVKSVGAHCVETVVTREGISTRVVERWAA